MRREARGAHADRGERAEREEPPRLVLVGAGADRTQECRTGEREQRGDREAARERERHRLPEQAARPLPALELGVKRSGHSGAAGEFVGRVRLRQEVKGKTLVICDILSAWEQDKLKANDVIFAD